MNIEIEKSVTNSKGHGKVKQFCQEINVLKMFNFFAFLLAVSGDNLQFRRTTQLQPITWLFFTYFGFVGPC